MSNRPVLRLIDRNQERLQQTPTGRHTRVLPLRHGWVASLSPGTPAQVSRLLNPLAPCLTVRNVPEKVKQDTWVYQTWGGQVRSRVVCSKCQKPSDTFDSFLDLSLDVNKGSRPKLLSMLQGFVKEDRLEGENKYNCEK